MNTDLKNELKELNSSLESMEKHYFSSKKDIPAGYFESMENNFFESLKSSKAPRESRSSNLFKNLKVSYAVAAVASFAIIGLGLFNIIKHENSPKLSQNEVVDFLLDEGEVMANNNAVNININDLSKDEIRVFLADVEGVDILNIN